MDERLLTTNAEGENGSKNINYVSNQPYPANPRNVIFADNAIVPSQNLHLKALKNLEKHILIKHLVLLVAFSIPAIGAAFSPYSSGYVVFWNALAAAMQLIAIFGCFQRYNNANGAQIAPNPQLIPNPQLGPNPQLIPGPNPQLIPGPNPQVILVPNPQVSPNPQLGSYVQLNLPLANSVPNVKNLICYVISFKIIGKIAIITIPILWWDWYNDCQNHYVDDINEDSDPLFGIGEIMATSVISLITFFIVNLNKVYYDRFAAHSLNLWCGGFFFYYSKNYHVLNYNAVWSPTQPITTYQKISTIIFFISYLTLFLMVKHQINAMKAYLNSD